MRATGVLVGWLTAGVRRTSLLLALPLLLAGCGGSVGTSGLPTVSPTASPTVSASASASASPMPSAAPSPSAVPATVLSPSPAPTAATPVLVLEPDGLGVQVGSSSVRHFAFATTKAGDISATVERVRGLGDVDALPDCGQGPRSAYTTHGLTLLFDGETWTGWSLQAGVPALSSADGVRRGLTWTALKKIRPKAMRSEESLGDEFYESDTAINGFLSGSRDTDTVTSLYAGETCFAR